MRPGIVVTAIADAWRSRGNGYAGPFHGIIPLRRGDPISCGAQADASQEAPPESVRFCVCGRRPTSMSASSANEEAQETVAKEGCRLLDLVGSGP